MQPAEGFYNPLKTVLPGRLLILRHVRGWTQSQAAVKIGISNGSLNAIEGGLWTDFKVGLLLKIARAFRVTPDYLLGLELEQDFVRGLYDQAQFQYFTTDIPVNTDQCFYCGWKVNSGRPHLFADCLLMMAGQHKGFPYIGNRFGLPETAVKILLAEGCGLSRK